MFIKLPDVFGKDFYVNKSKVAAISEYEEQGTKLTRITFESGFTIDTTTDAKNVAIMINSRLWKKKVHYEKR